LEVVETIRVVGLCRQMNCLPGEGGLLDQHWKFVLQLEIILDAIAEKEKMEEQKTQSKMRR